MTRSVARTANDGPETPIPGQDGRYGGPGGLLGPSSRKDEQVTTTNRFDRDPEAIAWARGKVQPAINLALKYAADSDDDGHEYQAGQWRRVAKFMQSTLLGPGRSEWPEHFLYGAFDERLPGMLARADLPAGPDESAALVTVRAELRARAQMRELCGGEGAE